MDNKYENRLISPPRCRLDEPYYVNSDIIATRTSSFSSQRASIMVRDLINDSRGEVTKTGLTELKRLVDKTIMEQDDATKVLREVRQNLIECLTTIEKH